MIVAWMIVLMIAIGRIVTVTIAMTVTVKTGLFIAAKGRDLLAVNLKNVAPGRPLPGGNLMIGDLQGTMIGGEVMMTVEALTLIIMIAAGTTTDVGKTDAVTRRMNGSMIGRPPDMLPRTEKVDGVNQDGIQVV